MMRFWIIAVGVLFPALAFAQAPDMCGSPLPFQASPDEVRQFRQQCTIQKLVADRADLANRGTAFEVEAAVAQAHAKALADSQGQVAEYWAKYVEGVAAQKQELDELKSKSAEVAKFTPDLVAALNATCSWRGVMNAPTAKMCEHWR